MHVISKIKLRKFWVQHADSQDAFKEESEYQKTLAIVEGMMSRELTEAETALFELLVLLIETYEEQHYPIDRSSSGATLESLIHEFDVDTATLGKIIGSLEMVTEVINDRRKINESQAEALAIFFNNLSPELALMAKDFK
jgi:HTH-type transcriptional regulator/antitoxin HigA